MIKVASVVLTLVLGAASGAALADAGQVVFVFGAGTVYHANGSDQPVSVGLKLEQGDRVVTEVNGRLQIRMADGGLIALRPSSEFVIEAFQYTAQEESVGENAELDRSFFRLLKGGL